MIEVCFTRMHRVVAVSSGSVDSHQKNGRCIAVLELFELLGSFGVFHVRDLLTGCKRCQDSFMILHGFLWPA